MTIEGLCKQIEQTKNVLVLIYEGPRISTHSKPCFCTADYVEDLESLAPEAASALVADFMSDMPGGKYVARIKKNTKAGAAEREIRFEKEGANSPTKAEAIGDIGRIERQLEERFENWKEAFEARQEKQKMESENQELKERIKELETQPKIQFFIEKLFDHAVEKGWIVPNKPPVIAGPAQDQVEQFQPPVPVQEAEAGNDSVNDSVNQIADKIGMDTIPLLEKLAAIPPDKLQKLAHLETGTLQSALNFI